MAKLWLIVQGFFIGVGIVAACCLPVGMGIILGHFIIKYG